MRQKNYMMKWNLARALLPCTLAHSVVCVSTLFIRRTVFVEDGYPIRIREEVKYVKVFVFIPDGKADADGDPTGVWEPSVTTLPAGAYVLTRKPR